MKSYERKIDYKMCFDKQRQLKFKVRNIFLKDAQIHNGVTWWSLIHGGTDGITVGISFGSSAPFKRNSNYEMNLLLNFYLFIFLIYKQSFMERMMCSTLQENSIVSIKAYSKILISDIYYEQNNVK